MAKIQVTENELRDVVHESVVAVLSEGLTMPEFLKSKGRKEAEQNLANAQRDLAIHDKTIAQLRNEISALTQEKNSAIAKNESLAKLYKDNLNTLSSYENAVQDIWSACGLKGNMPTTGSNLAAETQAQETQGAVASPETNGTITLEEEETVVANTRQQGNEQQAQQSQPQQNFAIPGLDTILAQIKSLVTRNAALTKENTSLKRRVAYFMEEMGKNVNNANLNLSAMNQPTQNQPTNSLIGGVKESKNVDDPWLDGVKNIEKRMCLID